MKRQHTHCLKGGFSSSTVSTKCIGTHLALVVERLRVLLRRRVQRLHVIAVGAPKSAVENVVRVVECVRQRYQLGAQLVE